MANEKRLRSLALGGWIEDNPLTSGAVAINSAGLAAMPAVGATEHMAITLDPDGKFGAPEIAWVTAHTLGATTATIVRGRETWNAGVGVARQHDRDVAWVHTPTLEDARMCEPLGQKSYNPAPGNAVAISVNVAGGVTNDLDAANLHVAFVAPATGKVNVLLSAVAYSGDNNQWHQWGVRNVSDSTQFGDWQACGVTTMQTRCLAVIPVTGLTPGQSYDWKWSQKRTGAAGTSTTQYDGPAGPAVMQVLAVNL
jgi:hypothetical protein